MTKIFTEPVLAKCSNREELAKENPKIGNPVIWFNDELLQKFGMKSVNFDFFINWSNNKLDRDLWLKRPLLDIEDINLLNDSDVRDSLKVDYFLKLVRFARANNLTASAIIYNDNQDWTNDQSHLMRVFWPKNDDTNTGLRIDRVDLSEIKQIIREKSGGPVQVGRV